MAALLCPARPWQDLPYNFVPTQYASMRDVPVYEGLLRERFERSLDLYLCARARRKRLNVDPESLIPQLPKPRDLRPFPQRLALEYKGHKSMVRSIALDPTGQWLCSGSDDGTVRLWEVSTARCVRVFEMGTVLEDEDEDEEEDAEKKSRDKEEACVVESVAWNPNPALPIVAVGISDCVVLLHTGRWVPAAGSRKANVAPGGWT